MVALSLLSTQWKEFHARRVEDALVLMADIMSSKPQQTSMQKSAVLSRPPLGSREKDLVVLQTATGTSIDLHTQP